MAGSSVQRRQTGADSKFFRSAKACMGSILGSCLDTASGSYIPGIRSTSGWRGLLRGAPGAVRTRTLPRLLLWNRVPAVTELLHKILFFIPLGQFLHSVDLACRLLPHAQSMQ